MSHPPNLFTPHTLLATWFGSGLMPKAPGTWGSLAALPFAWGIQVYGGPLALVVATLAITVIGTWASERYMAETGTHDPGSIVIDEVAGIWLVLIIAPPDWVIFALGFLFFRIADIFKPWPACWADKNIKGGWGVMLDDLLAAPWAMLALWGAMLLLGENINVFRG